MVPEIWIIPRGVWKKTPLKPEKSTLFLLISGEKAIEVYHAQTFTEEDEGKYNALVRKFKEFVEGKKTLAHERYVFNNRGRKEGEIFLSFLTNITSQTWKCVFDHLKDSMIRDHIISGIWSECTKVKFRDLADPDPNTIIRICKNGEITKTHTQDWEEAVHQVRHRQVHPHKKNVYNREKNDHTRRNKNECRRCGYNHVDRICLTKGQTCRNCRKVNVPIKKFNI